LSTQLSTRAQDDVRRVMTLATWTDARFLDPLLGFLLPGVGDVLGAAVGLYVVVVAARHRVQRAVIARMVFNLALDCLGGVVPVVGDLFDLVNRANLRNARLLERHLTAPAAHPTPAGRSGGLVVAVAALAGAIALSLGVAYALVHAFRPS
jgi:hypothetical protein